MPEHPDQIGRYEVESRIAQGGQGQLYKAYDPFLHRPVAIKLLREPDDEDLRARFAREARAVANLTHPNIVTVFEVGDYNGQPFMAMEYIHGRTLTSVIESTPLPTIVRRLELIEHLCDALAFAHRRNVIHRDIKPANLMVADDGRLKVVDFGIARAAAEANLTQAGLLVGTVNYMSPEQVEGNDLDGRSDMFAVGAVLYELLSRRQAFAGKAPTAVLHKILHGEPEPLETLCPDLDPAIGRIVTRALMKDPAQRFRDLTEMRAEIAKSREAIEDAAPAGPDDSIIAPRPDTDTVPPSSWSRETDRDGLAPRRPTEPLVEAGVAREREVRHEEARRTAEEARSLFQRGDRAGALALLEEFWPAHSIVSNLWLELSTEAARLAALDDRPAAPEITGPTPLPASLTRDPSPSATVEQRSPIGDAGAGGVDVNPTDQTLAPSGAETSAAASRHVRARYTAAAALLLIAAAAIVWAVGGPTRPADEQAQGAEAPVDVALPGPAAPESTVAEARSPVEAPTPAPAPVVDPSPPEPKSTPTAPATARPRDPSPSINTPAPATASKPPDPPSAASLGVTEPANAATVRPIAPAVTPAVVPPAPADDRPGAPPSGDARPLPDARPPVSPPSPVIPDPAAAVRTPPPAIVSDEDRIQRTLSAYAQALFNRDPDGVMNVYPNANREQVARMFDDVLEFTMEIEPRSVRVDGNTAVVTSDVRQWIRKERDQRRRTDQQLEFRLRRAGDGWTISSIRPR